MVFRSVIEHRANVNLERALFAYGRCNIRLRGEGLVAFVDFISVDLDSSGELTAGKDGGAGQLLCGASTEGRGIVGQPAVKKLEGEQAGVVDGQEFGRKVCHGAACYLFCSDAVAAAQFMLFVYVCSHGFDFAMLSPVMAGNSTTAEYFFSSRR